MATRKVPAYWILTDYTQPEEDVLAATLAGQPDGSRIIYNTTLEKTRIWDGSAFVTGSSSLDWSAISNKPATFNPSSHNHDSVYEPVNANIQAHISNSNNPHSTTKAQVGLSNVDNTSDLNKPISTDVSNALALKAPLNSPSLVTPNIGAASGASLAVTGPLTSSGGGVGYSTGSGGTVTQTTNRSTGVTLNKLCGNITMVSAAQAAQALVTFTLTNSFIAATDFVLVRHISATNGGAWNISTVASNGSCTISVRNVSSSSITEATPLKFVIIKSVTS